MKNNILLKIFLSMLFFGVLLVAIQSYSIRTTGINQSISESKIINEVFYSLLGGKHSKDGDVEYIDDFFNSLRKTNNIVDIGIIESNSLLKLSKDQEKYDNFEKKSLTNDKLAYELTEQLTTANFRVSIPMKLDSRYNAKCLSCHTMNKEENLASLSMTLDITKYKEYGFQISIMLSILMIIAIIILSYILNRTLKPYFNAIKELSTHLDLASNGVFETIQYNQNQPENTKKLIDKFNYLSTNLNNIFLDIDTKLRSFIGNNSSANKNKNTLLEAKDIITQLSLIYEFKQQIHLDTSKEEMYARLSEIYKKQFNILYLNIYEVDDKLKLTKMFQMGNKDYCINNITDDPSKCRVYKNADDVYSLDFHKACNCFNSDAYFHYCIDIEVGKNSKVLFNFIFDSSDDFNEFKVNLSFIKHYIKEISYEVSTKTLVKELEDMALKDALTGLYNRKFLENYISTIVPIAKREKYNIGLLMLDMDHFKAVNDEYGHDIGDKVLKAFASTVLENIRDSDVVIRFGGEEFIVLLVNIKSEEDVINIANKIRVAVANTEVEVYAGSTIKKTVSIGVSMYPQDSTSFERIMKLSDIALYEAKESGRNKIVRYEEKTEGEVEFF